MNTIDNTKVNHVEEQIFGAISVIAEKVIQGLSFDKTLLCTIVNDDKRKDGEYQVSDGTKEFTAYSSLTDYKKDQSVYVTIPNGDYNQQKMIIGKYQNDEAAPSSVTSPFDLYVPILSYKIDTDPSTSKLDGEWSLIANANGKEETFTLVLAETPLTNVNGYTRFGLKAKFKTAFGNTTVIDGEYGLRVVLTGTTNDSLGTTIVKVYDDETLSSSDMFGNPYNFNDSYYSQEKVFNIEKFITIEKIKLEFYQKGNFKINTGDLNKASKDNLFVSDIEYLFGIDSSEVQEEYLQIYSEIPLIYSKGTETELKSRLVVQSNGKYEVVSDLGNNKIKWYKRDLSYSNSKDDGGGLGWKPLNNYYVYPNKYFMQLLLELNKENQVLPYQTKIDYNYIENNLFSYIKTEDGKISGILFNNEYYFMVYIQEKKIFWFFPFTNFHPEKWYKTDENDSFYTATFDSIYEFNKTFDNLETESLNKNFDKTYWMLSQEKKKYIEITEQAYHFNNNTILTSESEEHYKAILFDENNKKKLESNILYFTNINRKMTEAEKNSALKIICEDGTNGNYMIYRQGGALIDPSQRDIVRTLYAKFLGDKVESLNDGDKIEWIFPQSGTMIDYNFGENIIYEKDENDNDIVKERIKINTTSSLVPNYKIKNHYDIKDNNNTIICKYTTSAGEVFIAVEAMQFGTQGTGGSEYTMVVELASGENAITVNETDIVKLRIYDSNNNQLDLGSVSNYTISPSASGLFNENPTIENKEAKWVMNKNVTFDDAQILTITATSLNLATYFPLSIRSAANYKYISGPTQVIYSTSGEPNYSKEECRLYDNNNTIVNTKDSGITVTEYLIPSVYLSSSNDSIEFKDNSGNTLWKQPILFIQNKYPSTTISQWDGENVKINGGTVLGTSFAAGTKNTKNEFSGVMLGDWRGDSDNDYDGTGIFGFRNGKMSYAFKDDGTAFIGVAGGGRIEFDGTSGVIQSGNYAENEAGMKIDLKNGTINSKNFSIDSDGNATFSGDLEAAGGTFSGDLVINSITSEEKIFQIYTKYTNLTTNVGLQIKCLPESGGSAPYVYFEPIGGAYAYWNFTNSTFAGNIEFIGEVTGVTAVFG